MKQIINRAFIIAAVFALLSFSAQAQTPAQGTSKIATVNLRKIFENYYKTKRADATLKEEASALEKEGKEMLDRFRQREGDYRKLLDKANDQSVSAEEREKSKREAEKKMLDLQESEQAIRAFERSAREKMAEKERIKRDAILEEIRDVVQAKAKAAGYGLVLDSSAQSVVYSSNDTDLTEAVLGQLNAAAPALAKPEEKSEKK